MDIFGTKTQQLLAQAQDLLRKAQEEMASDIQEIKNKQTHTDQRLTKLELQNDYSSNKINELQNSLDEIRDSAIRGEIASGQRTKDVAAKFNISSARVSQIAPRKKYNSE